VDATVLCLSAGLDDALHNDVLGRDAGRVTARQQRLFTAEIAFNLLWTPVFFGLQRMRAALVVLAALWLSVAGATVTFFAAGSVAGSLMAPYLLWVRIAGAPNFLVMRLNP
jgi:benzodiazapine receptor